MSNVLAPGRAPKTDAELARSFHERLRRLENKPEVRVGPWVISSQGGNLVATKPGDAVDLGEAVATTVDLGALPNYVTQKGLDDALSALPVVPDITVEVNDSFNQLYQQLTGFLNPVNAIQAVANLLKLQFAAPVLPFRLPVLPVGSIASLSPELLPNPGFDGLASIESADGWVWDGTDGHTSNGCAKIVADGANHILVAGNAANIRIPVDTDQQIPVSVWVKHTGVTATPDANGIRLQVSGYNADGLVSTTMVAGIASPAGSSGGWTQLSGTYVVPSGITAIGLEIRVTSAVSAGTVKFDDASLKKTNLMPMSLVDNLVASWNSIYEAFTGAVGATVTEVANAWQNLLSILQVPSLASLIVNPGAFNPVAFIQQFITDGINPQNMLAQLETAGADAGRLLFEQAPAAFQQMLNAIPGLSQGVELVDQTADDFIDAWEAQMNAIQQGITGTAQTIAQNMQAGLGGAQAQVNNAVAGVRQQLTGLQQQIATLFGLVPQTAVAAVPAGIDDIARTSTVASNDWGPGWTIIAATGTTHTDGAAIVWDKSGGAARFVIGRYDTPTAVQTGASTSYQKVKFVMSALMESPTNLAAPDAGNMLIGHALQDFSEFMFLRLKYNKAQLGYYQGTPDIAGFTNASNWHVFEEMSPSGKWPLADWELICGDITSARKYLGLALGARQLSDTNSGFTLTDDHIYSGMGFFSDDQGTTESAPGSISLFQLDNYSPVAYPGSGMSVYRTSTAAVTPNMPAFKLPSGFFDNIEYCSPDLVWDSTLSKLTVLTSGHYGIELSIRLSAEAQNIGMGTQIAKNGAISGKVCNVNRGPNQIAVYGHFTIALMAGDYIQPIFYNLSTVNITGELTGNFTYMTVAKLNP